MKCKMKIIGLILVLVVVFTSTVFATVGSRAVEVIYNNIKIVLNGKEITPTDANGKAVEPFTIDGTTYLPVRAISNALGLNVGWDAETNTVILDDPNIKTGSDSYEAILSEYSQKLKNATPILIDEYNEAAKSNQDGLSGLATLCNEKVSELAKICNDGIQEMAKLHLKQGSGSYDEYSEWAGKLQDVYTDEASKIQDAYMKSAR